MNPYYRINLSPSDTVTVFYHDQTFPVARFIVRENRFEVRIPKGGEVKIIPGPKFQVEAVWEGSEPVTTDPISSITSPPSPKAKAPSTQNRIKPLKQPTKKIRKK